MRHRTRCRRAAIALAVGWSTPAWAQSTSAGGASDVNVAETVSPPASRESPAAPEQRPPDVVTPPRVLSAPVEYPMGGQGEARVALELLVDVDGSVARALLQSGEEPFASAALAAARRFRFEPARAAGVPRAARIRFELHFSPPVTVPTPAPSVEPAAPPTPVSRVRVRGSRAPMSRGMTRGEVERLPGAFGDPFRAVSALPGVGPIVTGLPAFFVRGSPPGNVGYLIDGIRVPLLYHAFLGPSVIHPRMIERVDLHAGGYPARLGRFAGGIVEASLAPPVEDLEIEGSLRLIDAGAYAATPLSDGRGQLAVAGRYSYAALLISALTDVRLEYWDYQALGTYELAPGSKLGVFAFGALDSAVLPVENGEPDAADDNAALFHRVDVRLDQRLGSDSQMRLALTVGLDSTRAPQGLVRDLVTAARATLRSRLGSDTLLRAGASVSIDRYDMTINPNSESYLDVRELFPSRTDTVAGGYLDLVLTPLPGVSLTPGLRLDHYRSHGSAALGVSPRLAARFDLTEGWLIEHAFGLSHQPPSFVQGVPGVAVAGLPGGLQRSVQSSSGVQGDLSPWLRVQATAFHNAFFGLTDPFSLSQDLDLDADEANVRSIGQAVGLELSLQRRLHRGWGGSLSYTLSRSTRSHGRVTGLAGYDRPHLLNLATTHDLGRRWHVSARALFYSGVPGSRALGDRRLYDQSRSRPFFRFDLKLEKRFRLGSSGFWALTAEVANATLSTEVLRRHCEPDCVDEVVGPIVLPSLGVHGRL